MNLNVISLKRYSEPVCRKLEKAVCVAVCCKAMSMVLLAFPAAGIVPAGECGQGWERMNAGYMGENAVLRTGGREVPVVCQVGLFCTSQQLILWLDVCLQWVLCSCVGGGSLGICVRLGLISPLRAPMESVVGSSRHHMGTACWLSLVLEVSLELTAL